MSTSTGQKIINVITVVGIIATVIVCIYGIKTGLFTEQEVLKSYIDAAGIAGPLIFIFVQIIQVVIPIIPGGVSLLAGVLLFGPVNGFIYNYVGIVLGSLINFYLARKFGKPLIKCMVSEKTYNKYIGWLEKGSVFDKFFALAIFFPVAPDDFLCMVAGLSKMTFKKFTAIIVLGKPASIMLYSLALSAAGTWLMPLIA